MKTLFDLRILNFFLFLFYYYLISFNDQTNFSSSSLANWNSAIWMSFTTLVINLSINGSFWILRICLEFFVDLKTQCQYLISTYTPNKINWSHFFFFLKNTWTSCKCMKMRTIFFLAWYVLPTINTQGLIYYLFKIFLYLYMFSWNEIWPNNWISGSKVFEN